MNLLHMKYAVEVARVGSINKAAEELLIAQPNLSRTIRELEKDLNIRIFERTPKGMVMTPEGESFIGYARQILSEINDIENMYRYGKNRQNRFSISVPRAGYISEVFSSFTRKLDDNACEVFYKETDSLQAIKNVIEAEYKLGIIRYADSQESYFENLLKEKNLVGEKVRTFHYQLVFHKDSPLAKKRNIRYEDLEDLIEVTHGDPNVLSLSLAQVRREELPENVDRRILVFERASQMEVLGENTNTYMWMSPLSKEYLNRFGLCQVECRDNRKMYHDVLIYRKTYKPTEVDRLFIEEIRKVNDFNAKG